MQSALGANRMCRLEKAATAGLAAAILGFAVAACQPQQAAVTAADPTAPEADAPEASAPESATPAGALTVAEVRELVVENTVFGVDNKRNVRAAEYFSPDGTVSLKANTSFGTFNYDGTYFFDTFRQFLHQLPGTFPLAQRSFASTSCRWATAGTNRPTESSGNEILEGERLDRLE